MARLAGMAAALLLLFVGSATGAGPTTDVTGSWTPNNNAPAWTLTASGGGSHLHATWCCPPGHPTLSGNFDGALNGAGTAYSGSFVVTENPDVKVAGTMTFTIDSPTHITIAYAQANGVAGTIVLTRAAAPSQPNLTSTVTATTGNVEVIHADGTREPVTTASTFRKGDKLQTGVEGQVTLHFADGSSLQIDELTQVLLQDLESSGSREVIAVSLKVGEVAAKVNPTHKFQIDFSVKTDCCSGSVRGTVFNFFYDPVTKTAVVATRQGTVEVAPSKRPGATVLVPAGKEVEVTPTSVTKLAPLGKANARGGIDRVKAFGLVAAILHRVAEPCALGSVSGFSVKPARSGWTVAVKLLGQNGGWSTWTAAGSKAVPLNPLAKKLAAGCH